MSIQPVEVLFVCMGNICRSPTAEGVFLHEVRRRTLEHHIAADSAGTGAWHAGEPPDPRAQAMTKRHGIDISSQRARAVHASDYARFHYICAMDDDNLIHLERHCPKPQRNKLHLMCDFAPKLRGKSVPDPFYGGESGFELVFRMIEEASRGLIETILREFPDSNRSARA